MLDDSGGRRLGLAGLGHVVVLLVGRVVLRCDTRRQAGLAACFTVTVSRQ